MFHLYFESIYATCLGCINVIIKSFQQNFFFVRKLKNFFILLNFKAIFKNLLQRNILYRKSNDVFNYFGVCNRWKYCFFQLFWRINEWFFVLGQFWVISPRTLANPLVVFGFFVECLLVDLAKDALIVLITWHLL